MHARIHTVQRYSGTCLSDVQCLEDGSLSVRVCVMDGIPLNYAGECCCFAISTIHCIIIKMKYIHQQWFILCGRHICSLNGTFQIF